VGVVSVPDERLKVLAISPPQRNLSPLALNLWILPVWSKVRARAIGQSISVPHPEVDAIVHVVRCFENDDIIHVAGSVDPVQILKSSTWSWL